MLPMFCLVEFRVSVASINRDLLVRARTLVTILGWTGASLDHGYPDAT
jgi:hypothetical protein